MSALTRRAADVRITEYDLSTTIQINSNATAAMVGVSSMGPTTPKFYSNFDDFSFDWGPPNAQTSFDHYMAMKFFEDGNSLWAVRCVGTGALYSGVVTTYTLGTGGSGDPLGPNTGVTTLDSTGGVSDPDSPQWASYEGANQDALFLFTPRRGPGSYGNNIGIEIKSSTVGQVTGEGSSLSATGGTLTAATYHYYVSAIGSGGESLASAEIQQVVASGTTNQITLAWTPVEGAIGYYVYGRTASPSRLATLGANAVSFVDTGSGTADATNFPVTDIDDLPAQSGIFVVNVYDVNQSRVVPVESFTCSVTEQTDETGSQMEITQRINPFSRYVKVQSNVFSLVYTPIIHSVPLTTMDGGASGSAPTSTDIANAFAPFYNKQLYTIDVLMNNAGITKDGLLLRMSEEDWDGATGMVTDVVADDFATCKGMRAYLCGPPVMVAAAVKTLKRRRMSPRLILREEFTPAPPTTPSES